MIYMIGGYPRTGKTSLAESILKDKKIPFVSTDILIQMLKHGAPKLGVTDLTTRDKKFKKFFPFLKNFVHYSRYMSKHYVIEGDAFSPEQVSLLSEEYKIKCCFLGNSSLTLKELKMRKGKNNWIQKLDNDHLKGIVKSIKSGSKYFEKECNRYDIPYYDCSKNFRGKLKKAKGYLFKN